MQTLIMTALLIAGAIILYRQHKDIQRLYKDSQKQAADFQAETERQGKINSAFAAEIKRLKAEKQSKPVKLELPYFIQQPKTRYIGGTPNVN